MLSEDLFIVFKMLQNEDLCPAGIMCGGCKNFPISETHYCGPDFLTSQSKVPETGLQMNDKKNLSLLDQPRQQDSLLMLWTCEDENKILYFKNNVLQVLFCKIVSKFCLVAILIQVLFQEFKNHWIGGLCNQMLNR